MTMPLWTPEQAIPPALPGTVASYLANHPGASRRRYVVFAHGPKAHLYDRYLKHAGVVALCGKTQGEVAGYRQVSERELCGRCMDRLTARSTTQ